MSVKDFIEKDYYAALGVPKNADADAIKKAYRKLAVEFHPDKNKGDAAAEERFKEISHILFFILFQQILYIVSTTRASIS